MRWSLVVPLLGLFLFVCLSIQAVQRDQPSGRYFWWSGIPLDSKPLMPPGSACKDGTDRCGAWGPDSIVIDYGLLTKLLVVLAFPAFLLGGLIGKELARAGVSEVYSFMILMPLLISAWFYMVGWLVDSWRQKPST